MNLLKNAFLLHFMQLSCISVLIFFGCFNLVKAQSPGARPKPIIQDAPKPVVIGNNVRVIDDKEPAMAGSKPLIKYTVQTKPIRIAPDPNQPASGTVKNISPPKPYFTTIELDASHPKAQDYAYIDFYSAAIVSAIAGRAEFLVSESNQTTSLNPGGVDEKAKSLCIQCPGFLLHIQTKQNQKYEITVNLLSGINRLFYLFPDWSQTNYQSFAVNADDDQFSFIFQPDKDGYANLILNSPNKGSWTLRKVTIKKL